MHNQALNFLLLHLEDFHQQAYFAFIILFISLIYAGKIIRQTFVGIFTSFFNLIKFIAIGSVKLVQIIYFNVKHRTILFFRRIRRETLRCCKKAAKSGRSSSILAKAKRFSVRSNKDIVPVDESQQVDGKSNSVQMASINSQS